MKNKKGVSGIVTTIVIIGIALVAVGILWYVIQSVITDQQEVVENSSKEIFQTCTQAGYYIMNDPYTSCSGSIKYIGGQKCCTVAPTA